MKHLPMNNLAGFIFMGASILLSAFLLSACSAENFNRAGYEAVKNRQCNEQLGNINCNEDYPSYDEYQREKTEIPK